VFFCFIFLSVFWRLGSVENKKAAESFDPISLLNEISQPLNQPKADKGLVEYPTRPAADFPAAYLALGQGIDIRHIFDKTCKILCF